eukprot:6203370-Pleurochrysis_carterae.AAC.1
MCVRESSSCSKSTASQTDQTFAAMSDTSDTFVYHDALPVQRTSTAHMGMRRTGCTLICSYLLHEHSIASSRVSEHQIETTSMIFTQR